ncbi:MAG TPA: tetratricopeptide repeat protein [Pyrinomonadaceae bacterium]|nr:tetratricopeptide repeat protein [Pyrinomonadaceae bacterium]
MKTMVNSAIGVGLFLAACGMAQAQANMEVDAKYKSADTNNAVIEGRVSLPSGFAAERNVKITLRNSQMILFTRYSSKHGEFRFDNLSEGVYYVRAEVQEFDPVEQRVALGRGIVSQLTLQLREKASAVSFNTRRVVSVAELRQSVPTAARKEYERGLKFVAKGNVSKAATHFQKAVSIYPEYLAARNDLGAQFLKLNRIDEAEEHFHLVLKTDPKNFNANFNLGLVRVERKDYVDAISQLNRAIAIDRTRPVARLWLGIALLEKGELVPAEKELMKALVMGGGECIAAHYHLARIYLSRGDTAEALRAVRAYLDEAPKGEYRDEARQLETKLKEQARK